MEIILLAERIGTARRTSLVSGIALVATICFGLLVPVYTDEIVWRFHERAALDGGFDVWLNDLCGPATIARAPWFMMPARWFSATVNLALPSPLFVRLEGIACALLWLAMFWHLTARIEPDPARRNAGRTLGLALLGLGVLPLMLVLSRPEQPMILAVTAMLAIALARIGGPDQTPPWLAWMRCAVLLLIATLALSYHVKGVLYAVVAAACLLNCASGPRTLLPRAATLLMLSGLTAAAASYWTARFSCPGNAELAGKLSSQNVSVLLAGGKNILPLIPSLVQNAFPWAYLSQTAPWPEPQSSWLPPGLFSPDMARVFYAGMRLLWWSAMALGLAALFRFAARKRAAALSEPRAILALAILASVTAWGFSQSGKNFYESAHVLPLVVLTILLALSLDHVRWVVDSALPLLATIALPAALLSQAVIIATLTPNLLAKAAHGGSFADQPNSISAFNYDRIRYDVAKASRAAGLDPARRLTRPVIDDLTYFPLQRSWLPLHKSGIVGWWSGPIERDPVGYLVGRKSSGVIVGCALLPQQMLQVAHRSGEICAIGPLGLEALARSR